MQAIWRGHALARFIRPNSAYAPVVCELPCNVTNFSFEAPCYVGAYTYGNYQVAIGSSTRIGRFCSVGQQCLIGVGAHSFNYLTTHPLASDPSGASCGLVDVDAYEAVRATAVTVAPNARSGNVKIGSDVWIGARVIILGGVEIGDGAVVAAGSVVSRNVDPYSIVGGSPARHIKYRFDEATRSRLLVTQWWDRNLSCVGSIRDYSNVDLFLDSLENGIARDKIPIASYNVVVVKGNSATFVDPAEDLPSILENANPSEDRWSTLN